MIPSSGYKVTFDNVWMEKTEDLINEIASVWENYSALPEGEKTFDRAKQVVYLARNAEGQIIAISTAYPSYIKRLNNHFFAFRCFLTPENRIPGLMTKITALTLEYLETVQNNYDPKMIGVITEVQNERLHEHRREAVYPETGMVFIGYSKNGNQLRVSYFKGARI